MSLVAAMAAIAMLVTGCTGSGGASASTGSASPGSAGNGASASASASAGPASSGSSAGSAGTDSTGKSASLVASAIAGLKAGRSVHVNITSDSDGAKITFSQDSTATGGRQVMTFDNLGHATVLLISGVGYVQADQAGLMGMFGVSQAEAAQLAGRWISVRSGQKIGSTSYAELTDGITLSSVASGLTITGPYGAAVSGTVAGQRTLSIQGRVPASQKMPASARETMNVTASGQTRPVQFTLSGYPGDTDQMTFSDWGEKLSIPVPPNAQPASSLGTPSVA